MNFLHLENSIERVRPPYKYSERAGWMATRKALMAKWSTFYIEEEAAAAALDEIYEKSGWTWQWTRAAVMLPTVNIMIWLCLAMSLMLFVEKLSMAATVLCVKLYRPLRPHRVYRWEQLPAITGEDDPELGPFVYPVVLVQIPMFNEREVYHLSIGAVCAFTWPSDRLIIQVLDDSTDKTTRDLVQRECERWSKKGMNIDYISRDNRNGYKSGALREAMHRDYVKTCDYVAIFDADHQPPSDFLIQTIPFLIHNPDLALVQARWEFVNADDCLMTRIQEMSLNYHFVVEQESGSSTIAFFGFNGTAGVWRISAVDEAKGWKDRTTVEDMDLAVRACLEGWKFVYVGDLNVRSELPSTYKAYRYQQHRWACGPASLFRKMGSEIMRAEKASIWRKMFLLYNFFFARRIVSHIVAFFFYTVIIPLTAFFPELKVPLWGVVLIPSTITLLNAIGTPSSMHLMFIWIFFENVMSLHRCKAVFIGLLEGGRVNEWIVTEKLGNTAQLKPTMPSLSANKLWEKIHFMEIGIGIWLLVCAWQEFNYRTERYYIFIFPSSIAFIIMGCGYVGR